MEIFAILKGVSEDDLDRQVIEMVDEVSSFSIPSWLIRCYWDVDLVYTFKIEKLVSCTFLVFRLDSKFMNVNAVFGKKWACSCSLLHSKLRKCHILFLPF